MVTPVNGAAGPAVAVPQAAAAAQQPGVSVLVPGAGMPDPVKAQYAQARAWIDAARAAPGTPAAQAVEAQLAGTQVTDQQYQLLAQDGSVPVPGTAQAPGATPVVPAAAAPAGTVQQAPGAPTLAAPGAAPVFDPFDPRVAPAPAAPAADPVAEAQKAEIARMQQQQEALAQAALAATNLATQATAPQQPAATDWESQLGEDFDDETKAAIRRAVEGVQSQADAQVKGLEQQVAQMRQQQEQGVAREAAMEANVKSLLLTQAAQGLRATLPGFDAVNQSPHFEAWMKATREPMSGRPYIEVLDAAVDRGDVAAAAQIYRAFPHFDAVVAMAGQAEAALTPQAPQPANVQPASAPAGLTAEAIMQAAMAPQVPEQVPGTPPQPVQAPQVPHGAYAPAGMHQPQVPQAPQAPQVAYPPQAAAPVPQGTGATGMQALMTPRVSGAAPQAGQGAPGQPASGVIWTVQSINDLNANMAKGKIKGETATALLADLRKARVEGRIVG